MKVRISFYLVFVIFGLASCGVVPSNFKSPHDEHMHAEEILPSTVPNASIPILGNPTESQNTPSKVLIDHHQLNISDVLISDFHNVSDFNHVQRSVLEEDLASKKLPKGSGRSKKKSQIDTTRFIKPSHAKIDHAGINDTQHHGLADDQSSDSHNLQTDHEIVDLKTQGSLEDHSLESHLKTHHETEVFKFNSSVDGDSSEHHHLDTDHKTDDLNIQGSANDHSKESHIKPHHKTEPLKVNTHSSVDGNFLEHHHLETDHKIADLNIQGSVDDHSAVPPHLERAKVFNFSSSVDTNSSEHHQETGHKTADLNIQGSIDDHSSEPHHLETNHIAEDLKINVSLNGDSLEPHHQQTNDHKTEDVKISISVDEHSMEPQEVVHKTDNLGFHDIAEDHFPELDHASENFSRTDKNILESVNIENASAHFDERPGHSKDFSTSFDNMLKIPIHELNRKEKDFIHDEFGNETHSEVAKHDTNNLNENASKISHSDDLINSTKDLSHDWYKASQEIKNESVNNNLSEFSNSIKSDEHDSNNLNQDNSIDSVAAHSIDFTNDSNHTNKDNGNDSVVIQSNGLTKSLNEIHNNISEDLENMTINTSEFKNDSHHPPKTTESTREHFNQADNTGNLLKSTVASITNSKLFLNIHNSFMRLNPTEKPDSAKLKHVDKTLEKARSVSDDHDTSKISEGNSNEPSNIDANSREVSSLDRKDITSPSNTVADISVAETEVEFSAGNKDKILEDPIINNKSESFDGVTEGVVAVEKNASKGLFSSLGLDFLMNSELAKNAASAMKVFNFTDSALTDHIIDDQNDMHDLLDTRSSTGDDHDLSNSDNSEQFIAIDGASDSSTFNTLVTGSSKMDTESSTFVTERSSAVNNRDEVSEVNNNIKETFVKENNSLSVFSGTNGSTEALTPTAINATVGLANITMVPTMLLNSTTEFDAKTEAVQPDVTNTSDVVVEVKCPPPGICIFWFFAQDTCTINSHCLGSRICCRIGCSKTCVEI